MAQRESTGGNGYRGPVRRIRVVVADGRWQVESEAAVKRMTLPASWAPRDESALKRASYYEVVGKRGGVYRRQIADPTDTSVEIFERGQISRRETKRNLQIELLAPEEEPVERVRLVVHGEDLPLIEGRKKPHTDGYRPADGNGKKGG